MVTEEYKMCVRVEQTCNQYDDSGPVYTRTDVDVAKTGMASLNRQTCSRIVIICHLLLLEKSHDVLSTKVHMLSTDTSHSYRVYYCCYFNFFNVLCILHHTFLVGYHRR